jgi:hypothetical protein
MTSTQRIYRFGALVSVILAIVPGYYALTLDWLPGYDFDVIGVLWLIRNSPRMLAYALTAAFSGLAVYFAARAARG